MQTAQSGLDCLSRGGVVAPGVSKKAVSRALGATTHTGLSLPVLYYTNSVCMHQHRCSHFTCAVSRNWSTVQISYHVTTFSWAPELYGFASNNGVTGQFLSAPTEILIFVDLEFELHTDKTSIIQFVPFFIAEAQSFTDKRGIFKWLKVSCAMRFCSAESQKTQTSKGHNSRVPSEFPIILCIYVNGAIVTYTSNQ